MSAGQMQRRRRHAPTAQTKQKLNKVSTGRAQHREAAWVSEDDLRRSPLDIQQAFAAFSRLAQYKDLPEEDRDMFRASAYYMLNTAFTVFPAMLEKHINLVPLVIVEAVLNYRNAWMEFVGKWRSSLNCFDYSKFVRMKDGSNLTMHDVQNEEFSAFLFNKVFETRIAETVEIRQDVKEEIAAGKRKQLSLGSLKSAGDLFLMLNFKLTINTTSITNNTEVIELIDIYVAEIESRRAAEYKEKLSKNALVVIEKHRDIIALHTEASRAKVFDLCGAASITSEENSESDASTDTLEYDESQSDDDLPLLIGFDGKPINGDGTNDAAPQERVHAREGAAPRERMHVREDMFAMTTGVEEDCCEATEEITDDMYRQIRRFIYLLCSPILSRGELGPDGSIVNANPITYPEWMSKEAVDYIDFAIDVIMHIIVLFIHEHVQDIFKDKLLELMNNPKIAKQNKFNIVLVMNDYNMALMEMYCDEFRDKFGDLDIDRSEKMYLYGIQIINENKTLILSTMDDLARYLIPLSDRAAGINCD